jgi:pimeloyl-ACP methyl ester carboxylesterase
MSRRADALLFDDDYQPGEREAVINATLEADLAWSSPKYPFDHKQRRTLIARLFDRCHYPEGVARQTAALLQAMGKEARLAIIDLPVLVVQGMADTIFPAAHGCDLAARIKGARLLEVEGMGHDLEGAAIDIVFDEICALILRVDGH